jgi:NAD(P)-dependent dehydrogenase (short-subunit alcohol dehydrogenase family)
MSNYLIIGGSSGIGKKLCEQLTSSGHHVYATYFKNETQNPDSSIEFHQLNVLDESISLNFITNSIDALVYCPGSINLRPFERIKPADFLQDYNLQVLGAIKTIQAALPFLKKSQHASILLFSTVAVQYGLPFHSQVASSKGAIEGLTRALAAELAPGIRVNCIAPSLTDTPLASALLNTEQKREANATRHPLKRIGTTDDIANMASYLISEKASWITGQVFHVDGGMSSVKI